MFYACTVGSVIVWMLLLPLGGFFEELLMLLLSSMSPCFLVGHLPSRPMRKSSIMPVAIFFPPLERYMYVRYVACILLLICSFWWRKAIFSFDYFWHLSLSLIFAEWDCASCQMLWLFTDVMFLDMSVWDN